MTWLLSTPALPSWQVNMADSWWMNFSPIWKTSLWVQDIWKDGEYFKWRLSSPDRKSFQQLVFKAVNNRKRSGYVDYQRGQIDWPKSVFLQTQATIIRQYSPCLRRIIVIAVIPNTVAGITVNESDFIVYKVKLEEPGNLSKSEYFVAQTLRSCNFF